MKVKNKNCDLIRTIDEDDNVEDFSEDSDAEVEVKYYLLSAKICCIYQIFLVPTFQAEK